MGRLFGTDGARGVAITELTCEMAMQIGRAAAVVLTRKSHHKPKFLIGKDTRISSDVLESALIAGLCSMGADAVTLGVVPTPAVAFLVKKRNADAGVMISASHNSYEFNGIKLFSGSGYKLSDDIEEEIERLIFDNPEELAQAMTGFKNVGRVSRDKNAEWDYIRSVMKTIDHDLAGIRVAIDCANGSASTTVERLFGGLGATVYLINCTPNGININDRCGSTCMDGLAAFVKEKKCHIGVAFDGDADRCLAVDETGAILDGDKLIAIFARNMRDKGILKKNTAVVTVLTNLGFTHFAKNNDINMISTKVGDRYIVEQMLAGGYNLGGEQSGHIIFHDYATTGDGQLTAVQLLSILKRQERKASELGSIMERYPQVMINVKILPKWKEAWKNDAEIEKIISENQKKLGSSGRILVRESGTEPLIRVMIEGRKFRLINEMALEIADKIKERCPDREQEAVSKKNDVSETEQQEQQPQEPVTEEPSEQEAQETQKPEETAAEDSEE
ncbi:MAG: phosphoglucosamine mutase [Oscillospiraceae bacterium]|nr:phosphoglucosamine mutase [Oscillospiraceae bacterium]